MRAPIFARSIFKLWFLLLVGSLPFSAQAGTVNLAPFTAEDSGLLFTIKGSNTIGASLAPALIQDYLQAKGLQSVSIKKTATENEYRIMGFNSADQLYYVDVAAHGSSTGFKALFDKNTDVAMSSRPIKDAEVAALLERGDLRSFNAENVIAIDGLAIIVNSNNKIDTLGSDTIAKIFAGETTSWRDINGDDATINIYARDDNSGTWDTFKNLVLGDLYQLSATAKRFESNDQLSNLVASDPGGIGFVGLASVGETKVLAVSSGDTLPLKPLPLYVATEDYPLARRLYMYSLPDTNNPYIEEFLSFTLSDTGQTQVQQVGFISQNPISLRTSAIDNAPKGYMDIVQHAERLSINFRFRFGSAELDNKAKQDILRLSDYVSSPQNKGKKIQLIGFGDRKSSKSRELVLSKMRAVAVKSALYKHGVMTESIIGFGSVLPVASNSEDGKVKNQRVEVWTYDEKFHDEISTAKKAAEENYLAELNNVASNGN